MEWYWYRKTELLREGIKYGWNMGHIKFREGSVPMPLCLPKGNWATTWSFNICRYVVLFVVGLLRKNGLTTWPCTSWQIMVICRLSHSLSHNMSLFRAPDLNIVATDSYWHVKSSIICTCHMFCYMIVKLILTCSIFLSNIADWNWRNEWTYVCMYVCFRNPILSPSHSKIFVANA